MSFLYLAIHHPKAEHRLDLLAAMHHLDEVMKSAPGLQWIDAWAEVSGERIIALSIWETRDAFQAALGKIGTGVAGVPFEEWEERPRELIRAEEIVFPE